MNKEEMIKAIYEKIDTTIFGYDKSEPFEFIMIGNVLDWMTDFIINNPFEDNQSKKTMNFLYIWKHKRRPLEEQSDECIEYIFNLIK